MTTYKCGTSGSGHSLKTKIKEWGETLKEYSLNINMKKMEIMKITNQPQSGDLRVDEESKEETNKIR